MLRPYPGGTVDKRPAGPWRRGRRARSRRGSIPPGTRSLQG